MATPSLSLFTSPHQRGRAAGSGKYGEFFSTMKENEIKRLPDELQGKKSLQAYVPKDIRPEFVFRTNPDDNQRYVARVNPANKVPRKAPEAKQEPAKVVKPEPVKVGKVEPPKPFDA